MVGPAFVLSLVWASKASLQSVGVSQWFTVALTDYETTPQPQPPPPALNDNQPAPMPLAFSPNAFTMSSSTSSHISTPTPTVASSNTSAANVDRTSGTPGAAPRPL
ncbi:hypothetical protein BOTBODRAFT_56182 [Botryobasidium botryosum FD-172 SS1]|uniref:Uncharacterized protein n=1 Tax=Botryobasidium botryosum (strain FD-172 SS1) TaxID=930990 RepID=A0A067MFE5_BOTB1|nr:hypothetical protein BOTBODRAFT_56182 [Botryobasidium botryosum FD-172 SS1]